jgi:hypothetical protein
MVARLAGTIAMTLALASEEIICIASSAAGAGTKFES